MTKDKSFIIKPDGTGEPATLRARDVEFQLKDANIDPRVKNVLCGLAERLHYVSNQLVQITMMLDKTIDVVGQFAIIGENMKDKMERIHADVRGEAEADGNTSN